MLHTFITMDLHEEYYDDVARTHNVSQRGRPRKVYPAHEVESRLTPPDGKEPAWDLTPFTKFVAFEEGGPGTDKQLHYHILLETTMSDYALAEYWNNLCPLGKGTGNKLFRNGKPHEKTTGYIAKHKRPVVCKGYTEKDLQDWYVLSDEYVKALKQERERYRKIKSKGRKAELKSVEQDVRDYIKTLDHEHPSSTYLVRCIINRFLELCKERNFDFPTKSQMDNIVYRLMYDINPSVVVALFSRHLNIE